MPNEKKQPTKPRHPETTFIPPLHMILSVFKKKDQKSDVKKTAEEKESEEKAVEKIIDKLNKEK
jgi:hypothetical protein